MWAQALDEQSALLTFWESPKGSGYGGLILAAGRRTAQLRTAMAEQRALQRPDDTELDDFEIPQHEAELRQLAASFAESLTAFADKLLGPFERERCSAEVAVEQAHAVKAATPWAVTPDLVTLVEHAAITMPVETVERADLASPNGFVYLGKACRIFTEDGRGAPYRALHWQSDSEQVTVVCYSARGDYIDGEDPLPADRERLLPRLSPGPEFSWRFGDPTFGEVVGGNDPHVPQLARFLKALWTISAQRIATVSHKRPDRATCRRANRAQLPTDGIVRVIQLRRPETPGPGGGTSNEVEWTHRWIVRGHWRNQYLPSRGMHREQWIDQHVKGPEDLPLVVKPIVVHVAR